MFSVFTDKCLCVACNDLNNLLMGNLGLKPLRIRLGYNEELYMYTSILIYSIIMMPMI